MINNKNNPLSHKLKNKINKMAFYKQVVIKEITDLTFSHFV